MRRLCHALAPALPSPVAHERRENNRQAERKTDKSKRRKQQHLGNIVYHAVAGNPRLEATKFARAVQSRTEKYRARGSDGSGA